MPRKSLAPIRREQVVDAVLEILATEGWDGVTLRRISEVSGLSNGAMSHFVGTKDQMVAEATRVHFERYLRRAETVTAEGTVSERLTNWIFDIVARTEGNRKEWACWLALWGQAPFDPVIRKELERVYRAHAQRLAAIIEEGRDSGEIAAEVDPKAAADQLIALIDGLALRRMMATGGYGADAIRKAVLAHVEDVIGLPVSAAA